MPVPEHQFYFDVNFAFGDESVFTLVDDTAGTPSPPILGYFLTLAGPIFGLLDGQDLVLL